MKKICHEKSAEVIVPQKKKESGKDRTISAKVNHERRNAW